MSADANAAGPAGGTPSKSKSRFGSLFGAKGKELLARAKVVGERALEKSKAGLKLATNELVSHIKDVYDHGEQASQGMGDVAKTVKVPDQIRKMHSGSKVAVKKTANAARGASLRVKELVEPTFYVKMDCDEEAAFSLVYHYSNQFSKLRTFASVTEKQARDAGDLMNSRQHEATKLKQRLTSMQAELSALPNVMSVLTATVQTVYDLKVKMHGVEAEMLALEALCDRVDDKKAVDRLEHVIAQYRITTDATVAKQKRTAEIEYKKARREASKSASKMIKERQTVLGEKFQEQMALYREDGHGDNMVAGPASPGVSLSRRSSFNLSPEEMTAFQEFLASRRNSPTDIVVEEEQVTSSDEPQTKEHGANTITAPDAVNGDDYDGGDGDGDGDGVSNGDDDVDSDGDGDGNDNRQAEDKETGTHADVDSDAGTKDGSFGTDEETGINDASAHNTDVGSTDRDGSDTQSENMSTKPKKKRNKKKK